MRNYKKGELLMIAFITSHLLEIFLGLVSAGALAFCKYLHKQMKNYKKLLEDQESQELDEVLEEKLEPIINEIEELRKYIREVGSVEKAHMDLIISSYKFRLVQLCKEYLKQGFMSQDQYDQLTEFYKVYSGLGGNGQAHEYYEKTIKLEIK